jgi:ferredoxin
VQTLYIPRYIFSNMVRRKIIEIDEGLCTGCGDCVKACAEGAIELRNGKAHVISERFCDGLGACIGECPTGALKIVEREADDFNEEAVHEHLSKNNCDDIPMAACPGSGPRKFASKPTGEKGSVRSQLSSWPIQIRLVPVKHRI